MDDSSIFHKLSLSHLSLNCYKFGLLQKCPEVNFGCNVFIWHILQILFFLSLEENCTQNLIFSTSTWMWRYRGFIQKSPLFFLVSASMCSLSFSFSSLSNKDLDAQWWSFWWVLYQTMTHVKNVPEQPSGIMQDFLGKFQGISWCQYTFSPTPQSIFFFLITALLRYNSYLTFKMYNSVDLSIFRVVQRTPQANCSIFSSPWKGTLHPLAVTPFHLQQA